MAEVDYQDAHEWQVMHWHSRDHVGIVAAESLLGPMGVIVAVLVTNFNQHGWELWDDPKEPS